MANDCLNIGIIGAGKISELHAYGYLQHPKARIVAVADNRAGIAESELQSGELKNTLLIIVTCSNSRKSMLSISSLRTIFIGR